MCAAQTYRHKSDHTVGSNESTKSTAPGHEHAVTTPPPGGENKTPAPLTTAGDMRAILRDTSWGRAGDRPQDQNSGKNGYGGPSSLSPGERAPDATIRATAKTDLVLDAILKAGAHGAQVSDDWQTRAVDGKPMPATFGHAKRGIDSGSPGAVVPPVTGHSPMADEATRRAAQLRNVK